jgi:putative colanic acid biosynthesis acetyltransferase WcaF
MTPLDAATTRPLEGGPSFTLGNRLFRLAWMLAWTALARFTPPPLHGWRRLVLRCFGARIGRGVRVHGSASIWHPGNLRLDDNVLIGPGARIYNQGTITVGEQTVISQRAHLCASTHDVNDPHFQLLLRPIVIGRSCWVAAEAFVGPGATMCDRSVLGARGVLHGTTEPDGIYAGNPAELIRQRKLAE